MNLKSCVGYLKSSDLNHFESEFEIVCTGCGAAVGGTAAGADTTGTGPAGEAV